MLHIFFGNDREKARVALSAAVSKATKKGERVVRLNDMSTASDLQAALKDGGLFAERRIVVLDGVCANEEVREAVFSALEAMGNSEEQYFLYEEKLDAVAKRRLEKVATSTQKFETAKKREEGNFFAIANSLRRGEKKALWISLQRELAAKKAPEAIHGVLFWGAKDMLLKARTDAERRRARSLIARLVELPHEARRRGEDLEYALERIALSGA